MSEKQEFYGKALRLMKRCANQENAAKERGRPGFQAYEH